MTRKCTKCGHKSTGLFRKKHRCILCGAVTERELCRKLRNLRDIPPEKEWRNVSQHTLYT